MDFPHVLCIAINMHKKQNVTEIILTCMLLIDLSRKLYTTYCFLSISYRVNIWSCFFFFVGVRRAAWLVLYLLLESRILFHCRKNSETQRPREQNHDLLSNSTLSGERAGRLRWAAALSFFGKLVIWRVKMMGSDIHCRGRGLGLYFLIFIPSPPSQGEEGFLSLFS